MRMLYNPQLKGAYNFVPGVMAMVLLLVCTMMTAITIVKEKEMGTMEVMLVSPMRPQLVVLAKAVPYLLLSIINITSILLLSVFALGVPINGSLALLDSESILFTLRVLSFGLIDLFMPQIPANSHVYFTDWHYFLPTIMLSGFMFPSRKYAVAITQLISNVVPAKWFYINCKISDDKRTWV